MKKDKVLSMINPLFFNGVAHRGLHTETITENSLSAFKNALEHNISLELDVHLSKDNELFVCHDASLKRTTGKEGIIEDLTSKNLAYDPNAKLLTEDKTNADYGWTLTGESGLSTGEDKNIIYSISH